MAKATGLIFLLFDITSIREVPFAIPLYIQCTLHGHTSALLCVPFIFAHREKCQFCGRHGMASIHNGNFFIGPTLNAEVLFKQLLIHTAV